jgi:hypothetical protein
VTAFKQLVAPDTTVEDEAGYCHRMARAVYSAPWLPGIDSATKAANITQWRHYERDMPNVAAVVWFDHWGTYGGVYANWGHVVAWIPGHGFLSSPHRGIGQQWYPTLAAVERAFNCSFRFWSEDINGLRVAEPESEDDMPTVDEIVNGIMQHPIQREGSTQGGWTNLRAVIAWFDAAWEGTQANIAKAATSTGLDPEVLEKAMMEAMRAGGFPTPQLIADAVVAEQARRLAAKQAAK